MGKSLDEQETIINWLRCDDYAVIYTSDSTMITRFDKFVESGEWELIREDRANGAVIAKRYKAPKKLVFGRPGARRHAF